ncbi:hypothetical protein D0Y65_032695 [Glycine soja]|uniref:Uncharacterized protein n=2 Tax=Glycine subgen. Soja TaxID=1462606 RepID=K7M3N1_SOYBN|nr:hypothetical protein JHK87_038119 [Glycine soja]KHN30047.1 hypothetical protein glysoja_010425 [Glycine soja]RZB84497.1 hypothetical protein D0Y65_032695 [Glycine soja]
MTCQTAELNIFALGAMTQLVRVESNIVAIATCIESALSASLFLGAIVVAGTIGQHFWCLVMALMCDGASRGQGVEFDD